MTTTQSTPGRPPDWPPLPHVPPLPRSPGTPLPTWSPPAEAADDWLRQRLFENRILLLHGPLDRSAATRLTAQLLALEAAAQRAIRLHIDSPWADLTAALLVCDALDMVQVTTHGLVMGEAGGATLAVLMATGHRAAYRHARIRLTEPPAEVASLSGDPREAVEHHAGLLADFVNRLAERTHRPADEISADLKRRRYLTAPQAVQYGLLDEIATPGADAGVRAE